jgi:hypothetical protein
MKPEDFVSEVINYWPKLQDNKSISSSLMYPVKFISGDNLKRLLAILKESYSPSRTIGVYEIKQIINNESMGKSSGIEEKEIVECDCCGNRFQYQMGVNDNCGLCHFPYEWTKMVLGYRNQNLGSENKNPGFIPKTIEDGYHRMIEVYRTNLKKAREEQAAKKSKIETKVEVKSEEYEDAIF